MSEGRFKQIYFLVSDMFLNFSHLQGHVGNTGGRTWENPQNAALEQTLQNLSVWSLQNPGQTLTPLQEQIFCRLTLLKVTSIQAIEISSRCRITCLQHMRVSLTSQTSFYSKARDHELEWPSGTVDFEQQHLRWDNL